MSTQQPITREYLRSFKRVTVAGLGLFGGGLGAARFFSDLGAKVTVTDLAEIGRLEASVAALGDRDIEFHLGGHRIEDFTDTDLVVANQAVRPDSPYLSAAEEKGIPVLTETGIALALNRSPLVAVTGTAGKSTTASLIAAMLACHDPGTLFGGNIGGDLVTRVECRPSDSPLVAELSSFQLLHIAPALRNGTIAPPRVAVASNLAPNHMDWHHDLDEYYQSKKALILAQGAGDWTVLNVDDPELAAWAEEAPGRVVACAMGDPGARDACFAEEGRIRIRLSGKIEARIPLDSLKLRGGHNVINAVQAAAAAFVFSGDAKAVADGLSAFGGLPHRMELVADVEGRTLVNDSKCTTPEAAILALASFDEPKVLIAGGYDKQAPFGDLGRAVQERAHGLVLIGAAAERILKAVKAAEAHRPAGAGRLPVVNAGGDFDSAVRGAFRLCPAGGVVLLSPACASWGMFLNYEDRGEKFRSLALGLGR